MSAFWNPLLQIKDRFREGLYLEIRFLGNGSEKVKGRQEVGATDYEHPRRGGEELWSGEGRVPHAALTEEGTLIPNGHRAAARRGEEVPGAATWSGMGGGSFTNSVGTALCYRCRDSHLIPPPTPHPRGQERSTQLYHSLLSNSLAPRPACIHHGWGSGVGFCTLYLLAFVQRSAPLLAASLYCALGSTAFPSLRPLPVET